ncbi:hypothetical protein XaFJ1_GM001851 [Xanthomonas albilineans]|nr:hypothetical protein XaFJ1_GM001851 [Xanthomonas albilineans]
MQKAVVHQDNCLRKLMATWHLVYLSHKITRYNNNHALQGNGLRRGGQLQQMTVMTSVYQQAK